MDKLSPEKRSWLMSRIRSKDTKPELIVRRWLWAHGYRYRLHRKDLPGKPDLVFIGKKKAIFINGCFWHMHNCPGFKMPASNTEFWENKLEKNRARDKLSYAKLHDLGWKFRVVWECRLEKRLSETIKALIRFLEAPEKCSDSSKN